MVNSQSEISRLFNRSQSWVSKHQTRAVDPMPRDLTGARDWGDRNGLLNQAVPAPMASAPSAGNLQNEDILLKRTKREILEINKSRMEEDLIPRSEVEAREMLIAVEFRRAAVEYPIRARSILDRHIVDAGLIEKIITDLNPLAAELLNKSDPHELLAGKPPAEIFALLDERVQDLMRGLA